MDIIVLGFTFLDLNGNLYNKQELMNKKIRIFYIESIESSKEEAQKLAKETKPLLFKSLDNVLPNGLFLLGHYTFHCKNHKIIISPMQNQGVPILLKKYYRTEFNIWVLNYYFSKYIPIFALCTFLLFLITKFYVNYSYNSIF